MTIKNRLIALGLTGAATSGVALAVATLAMPPSHAHATVPKQAPATYAETLPGSVVKLQMMPIPGGKIKIGSQTVEVKPFFMASTETPWEAYDVFTQSGPPSKPYDQTNYTADAIARPSRSYILPDLGWGHHGYPVINVSFTSVTMFCRWLSSVTKKKYRLPTEAEWEIACRDGASSPVSLSHAMLDKVTWYSENCEQTTHPVGQKAASKFGLYDMFGNVGEWATDVAGQPVLCGSTFQDGATDQTSAMRKRWQPKWQETDPQLPKSRWWLSDAPFAGFRVVCEP